VRYEPSAKANDENLLGKIKNAGKNLQEMIDKELE
jgi:hypothetical protein